MYAIKRNTHSTTTTNNNKEKLLSNGGIKGMKKNQLKELK